jgi:hypothetical protein
MRYRVNSPCIMSWNVTTEPLISATDNVSHFRPSVSAGALQRRKPQAPEQGPSSKVNKLQQNDQDLASMPIEGVSGQVGNSKGGASDVGEDQLNRHQSNPLGDDAADKPASMHPAQMLMYPPQLFGGRVVRSTYPTLIRQIGAYGYKQPVDGLRISVNQLTMPVARINM